ncbi:MAG TPA: glycosyltransferase family 4 protein [Ramlibacter sp.]|nr:glycosyltransferase family 4 protein [Ramlibacter sp.]
MTTQVEGTPAMPRPLEQPTARAEAAPGERFIYIAGPNTPMGGGMFKVAEYLVQSQQGGSDGPVLRMLETRGGGSSLLFPLYLAKAIAQLVRAKRSGRLAGVHVNVAERMSLVRKGALIAACRMLEVPVVLHLHAAQLHHTYRALPAPAQALVRRMFAMPASCVVLGKGAADFVAHELRVPAERIEIVINGVPEPKAARRAAMPAVPHVVFLGNLSERKGVSDLLRALNHPVLSDRQLRLTLAGGGDVEKYAALAHELGVSDRVEFKGWADPATVGRLLSQADLLVLPSYDEGLPLAILEGLAHGVAVVCTPVGEIPHVLTDGVNASFVQPGDSAGIARAIARVLADPGLREQLERNGKALHQELFSLERFSTSVARIHQRHFGTSGRAAAQD